MKTAVSEVTELESWTEDDFGFHWDGQETLLLNGECLGRCTNGARFIVELVGRCVFDLESDSDTAEIRRLFGDRTKWTLVS